MASFDRFGNSRGDIRERGEGEKSKDGVKKIEGEKRKAGEGDSRKGGGGSYFEGEKSKEEELVKGVEGDVIGGETVVQKYVSGNVAGEVVVEKTYVPKYTSTEQDISWAHRGLVVTVLNGEAILVLQRCVFNAGFVKLNIIPLGTDKVFLRTDNDEDVNIIISEAAEFFDNFFSLPIKWNKNFVVRERGAWVRIYGVSLHAWNFDFFKLCVYDCG